MLIFDEMKTGFRLAPGGYQDYADVTPDLAAFDVVEATLSSDPERDDTRKRADPREPPSASGDERTPLTPPTLPT